MTSEERGAMLARLAELIDRANAAIDFHRSFDKPNQLAIVENVELRAHYVRELNNLLHNLRLEGEFHIREGA